MGIGVPAFILSILLILSCFSEAGILTVYETWRRRRYLRGHIMNKLCRKLLAEMFRSNMARAFREFREIKVKSLVIKAGDQVYEKRDESIPLSCFIVLDADHRGRDEFTINLGWSSKLRFPPVNQMPLGFLSPSLAEFARDEFTFRLHCLAPGIPSIWEVGRVPLTEENLATFDPMHEILHGFWTKSPEEQKIIFEQKFSEAFQCLEAHAPGFFEKLVRAKQLARGEIHDPQAS